MKRLLFMILGIVCGICCYAQRSATVNKVWLEHNVTKGGKKGMVVHTDFTVSGMKGEKVDCTAYFYDEYKNNLKTTYSGYKTVSDQACAWSYGNVTYDNSHWEDFDNFMPYEAMNLAAGKHDYYCKVVIYDTDNNILGRSEYYSFTGTGSNSKYSDLNNPDFVDNSEDIRKLEELIQELENQKRNCSYCHGTGKVPGLLCIPCSGTGTVKVGYRTPQFFTCSMCGGKGRSETFCTECKMKSIAISGYESCIKSLKETHGMTKESKQLYYNQKNKMAQTNSEFQENVNTMVDSYLDNPSYKSSVQRHSNGEPLCPDCKGSGKCHICKGDKVYENSYDNYRITNCSFCKQTGVCPMCHGRGSIR